MADQQTDGFFKGMLWGLGLALPFWILIGVLILLALPPHLNLAPITDPAGIHLNGLLPHDRN